MKAITYSEYGGLEVLKLGTAPRPVVPPGWALIRVITAGVNPVDWKIMNGSLSSLFNVFFPVIPGWDVAGIIVQTGIDTPEFTPGDEVIAYARKDYVHEGAFAEYLSLPVTSLAKRPSNISWQASGALPLSAMSALRAIERAGLHSARNGTGAIIVNGAAGGVGRFALQILQARGYRIIGTGAARNQSLIQGMGARPVDYTTNWISQAQELEPDGFDAILDFGGYLPRPAFRLLTEQGQVISTVDPTVLKRGGTLSWLRADTQLLTRVTDLVENGKILPEEPEMFPLEGSADAIARSLSGKANGKLCIQVQEAS